MGEAFMFIFGMFSDVSLLPYNVIKTNITY